MAEDAPNIPTAEVVQYIVSVKPGSAAENALRFALPQEKLDDSVESVIKYGLGLNQGRKSERAAETIRVEMKQSYGITANNSQAITPEAKIKPFFTLQTAPDQKTAYMGVDIIVASKQTAGLEAQLEQ